jgi:DeoR/GlpR family transcriptional regulator of sugar metabolism
MAKPVKITAEKRHSQICQMLHADQQVSVPELAKKFGVTNMTIHRDLDKLQQAGQIKKTWGGAKPAERMVFEFDFAKRRHTNKKEKQAIVKKAFEFISPGQKIILDTGTTTLELSYLMKDLKDITVITPSLAVASVLQFSSGIETVLLGGIIRKGSPDLTGLVTENNLDMFRADIAFLGTDGIGLDGTLYTEDMRIVKVDQKIRKRAAKNYILADSSKIGKTALATNGFISHADAFITDDGIEDEVKKNFEDMGATVITVKA